MQNPDLFTVLGCGNDDGSVYLDRCGEAERVTLAYSLSQSSEGTAGFGQVVVKILADCGITRDDATQVSEVFHRV